MKSILRKLFFWNEPAKGAFLALTMLVVLPRLLLTLGYAIALPLFLQHERFQGIVLYSIVGTAILAVAILLYELFQCVRLIPRKPFLKPFLIGLGVTVVLMAGFYGALPERAEHLWWLLPAAFAVSYIVYLYYPTVKIRDWLLAVVPSLLGGYVLYYHSVINAKDLTNSFPTAIRHWEVPYPSWLMWLLALCGIASLAAAYLLSGRLIAKAGRVSFRNLFGKGVAVLWGLFVIAYLTSVVMFFFAMRDYRKAKAELDAFWGTPVNFQSINDLYQKSGHIEQPFWDKLTSLKVEFPALNEQYDDIKYYPQAVLPPEIHEQWKRAFAESPEMAELERMLDEPLPLPERWSNGLKLTYPYMNVLSQSRSMARFETWRIRLALEEKDIHSAQTALRRMDNIADVLQQDYNLVTGLVRIAIEGIRASAFARILESGLADEQWLLEQETLLLAKENNIPDMHKRAIMGEAADMQKVFDSCLEHTSTSLFLTSPEVWLFLSHEGAVLTRCYCISDFSDFPEKPAGLFAQMTAPALRLAGTKSFPKLIATLRISRAMIAAELARRQNGCYPEAMEDLPIDPFSGEPLKYTIGQAEISEMHLRLNENPTPIAIDSELQQQLGLTDEQAREFGRPTKYVFESEWRSVDAVKIWSVGPNGIDENGRNRLEEYEISDDICFPIRLNQKEQETK